VSGRKPYAGYDVLAKWSSPSFDERTRDVLAGRLEPPAGPRFLEAAEYALLQAVVARLIPQPDRSEPIPVAAMIDDMLAGGRGDGFRFEGMPPMREAWRRGLAALEAEAARRGPAGFASLAPAVQDAVLEDIQAGRVEAPEWADLSPARFFKDVLLKAAAGFYYAHPDAWSEIGFGGPASPRGYVRLGFDQRDPWEAKRVR
jgi:hypothetical protein